MNARTLAILAAVTTVLAVGALLVTARGDRSSGTNIASPALFATLTERVNDVAAITIHKGEDEITLERSTASEGEADREASGWVVASKGGYPAKFDQVKASLMSVVGIEDATAKTSDPALHARIGVEKPAAANDAALVTLTDADDQPIAAFIIGDSTTVGSTQATYVRSADSTQSWLVQKRIDFPIETARWLDAEIIRLDRNPVKSTTITHPDGDTLRVSRASKDEQNFRVADLPEGRELTSPAAAALPANALSYLSLEDVRPATEAGTAIPADAVVAEYKTFDGLTIRLRTWTEPAASGDSAEPTYWAALEAIAAPPSPGPAAEANEAPASSAELDETAPEPETGPPASLAAEPDAPATPKTDPALIAAEAEELNEKLVPWHFAISSHKAETLRTRLDTLLKAAAAE